MNLDAVKGPGADTPATRRTQAERREESDRRMLQAATELIAEHGVSGTSLADIGERAGFSRGLPAFRYGSKVGLIKALLESMESRSYARRVVALEGKHGLAALRTAIAHRIDTMRGSAGRQLGPVFRRDRIAVQHARAETLHRREE